MDTETIDLAPLASLAAEAAAADAATEAALDAEAALLDKILAMVRPAVRACGARIKTSDSYSFQLDQPDADALDTHIRGICVDGPQDSVGPSRRHHLTGNTGPYGGSDLVLTADGWARLVYEGRWSQWQGSASWWVARKEPLTSRDVACVADVASVVRRLSDALAAADPIAKTRRQTARAEQLRAVLALLK
jgi:hypothetical protein